MGRRAFASIAATAVAAVVATTGQAAAPPVGVLPAGPVSSVVTRAGELVAVALPHRSGGREWRIARKFDSSVLREVSEADVGSNVVLVFKTTGRGSTTLAFGLTRGEKPRALESRQFRVQVR